MIPCVLLQSQQANASINKMNSVFLDWSKQAGLNLTKPHSIISEGDSSGDFEDGIESDLGVGFGGPRGFAQRSAMVLTIVDMLELLEYGCWCYFDGDYTKGRGEPVDNFDDLCKQLHHNYDCAAMDAESEADFDCLPWEADYQVFSFYSYSMDIEMECTSKNRNNKCNQRSCIIEMTFVLRLMQQYHIGSYPYDRYQTWAGFDVETCSPVVDYHYNDMVSDVVGKLESDSLVSQDIQDVEELERGLLGIGNERQCCGRYPDRFPYKPKSGMTECCGWRTYDTRILNCCGDLSLEMSCF